MSAALLWLSGADPNVLSHCERERNKFVAMGGTVVTTSVLATVAATFTVHEFLHAPLVVALLVGIGWGLAIMNLDRWLLISIRRQDIWWKTVLMAAPRVALALIIGIVIAEPLVLRVFDSEVNAQALRDKQNALADGKRELKEQYAAIPQLKQEQVKARESLTGVHAGAALLEAPEYRQTSSELERLEKQALQTQQEASCELDGTCGTSKSGSGPVYEEKKAVADELTAQADAARRHLGEVKTRLLAQEGRQTGRVRGFARSDLTRVAGQLQRLREQHQDDVQALRVAYRAPVGLLDRVEALGKLTSEHASMWWIRLFLFLFILAIDSMPAIAKILMSLGKPSLYEAVQVDLERADELALGQQTAAYATAGEISASVLVDEAKARKAAAQQVQDDLVDQAVAGMREAGEKFVARWRKAVVDSVDDLVEVELRRTGLKPERPAGGPAPRHESNGGGPAGP
jgi:hypothetical protein